ncbi:MMPL family transporter [Aliivibrio sp. S3MY1]|uniref:MMPL family transporter n=1 Tax=unclassified Aliivibrio TaxID=2645654 RepID=UPI0023783C15|nr:MULTISPECIES: MMPL family transporter [unclassified Aliivibrio]MDD9195692.1 MMPL family transporter [Aliivibrio sp. S3MY1]MDD9199115.1 MMPL family transporter [Aliivibrio sp. S2MY1]
MIMKPRLLALIWSLVLLIILGVFGYQASTKSALPIETNILALLPENQQDPVAQQAFDNIANTMSDKVVFVLHQTQGQDKTLITAVDSFSQALTELPMFDSVTATVSEDQQQAWGQYYFPARAQLLSDKQKQQLTNKPEQQVQKVLHALYNPFSGVTGAELESDPFLLFRDYLSGLVQSSGNIQIENGYLTATVDQQKYIVITADLAGSSYQLSLQQQLPDLLAVEQKIETQFDVDIQHTGVIFYAAHGTESAKGEISTIGLGSLIGIFVLVLVVYRSTLPLALALLSITTGLFCAYVLTISLFGSIHLFSLVFGASLIGVSIDYAFHFLTDRLNAGAKWNSVEGIKQLLPAITLGLITSLIGYLGMLIAPFPGLQQLSLFSAIGLTAAYFTVVCWYPVLASKPSKHHVIPAQRALSQWLLVWQQPLIRLVLPLSLLIASVFGVTQAKYDDDIRQLQALPQVLQQQEREIKAITGVGGSQQLLLVRAKTEEALLQKLERVSDKLEQGGNFGGFQSISRYVPSQKTQQENYQLVTGLYEEQADAYQEVIQQKQPLAALQPYQALTIEGFLASSISETVGFLWLGHIDEVFASVITFNQEVDSATLSEFAKNNDATYLNKAEEISTLFAQYRQRITELLLIAYAAIFLLLLPRYKVKQAFLIVLPPFIAGCAGLAVTVLTGVPLNLFNLLALMLILGIGIDYTLFFAEQNKQVDSSHKESTLLAISLSALTTILSFGLLALSETQAIHSFGITVLTGIIVAWLLAPLSQLTPSHIHSKRDR